MPFFPLPCHQRDPVREIGDMKSIPTNPFQKHHGFGPWRDYRNKQKQSQMTQPWCWMMLIYADTPFLPHLRNLAWLRPHIPDITRLYWMMRNYCHYFRWNHLVLCVRSYLSSHHALIDLIYELNICNEHVWKIMIVVVAEPPAQPLASAEERVGRHALRMFPHRLHEVTEWGAPEMRHKPHDLMWTFQRFGLKVLWLENLAFTIFYHWSHEIGWFGLKPCTTVFIQWDATGWNLPGFLCFFSIEDLL